MAPASHEHQRSGGANDDHARGIRPTDVHVAISAKLFGSALTA